MRKPCIALSFAALLLCADIIKCAPAQKSLQAKLNPYYLKAMAAYKKLESKLPREELRAITTIGILNGAKEAEQQMERHLIEEVKDLLLNTNVNNRETVLPKIEKIEEQLNRDQKALEILTKSMDLAMKTKDVKTFHKEIQEIAASLKEKTGDGTTGSDENNVGKKVSHLRKHILQQMNLMKHVVDDKIDDTLDYLIEHADNDGVLAKASTKVVRKRQTDQEEEAEIRQIKSILTEDDFRNNLVLNEDGDNNNKKKDNDDISSSEEDNLLMASNNVIETNRKATEKVMASNGNATETLSLSDVNGSPDNMTTLAKQEEGSPELLDNNGDNGGGGGGGLVGIITSLSGGEGGSDIGALIGALTGVISQLFGPGGLDIESLLSSATSLISGLLAGNKNFGTVLGIYVGTVFDGLSGGGGAINNGQFIGNFLGTVVASLSADPEEDDVPPRPLLFLQNVVSSFLEAKNRKSEEESAERKDGNKNGHSGEKGGGSDSSAFIKHVVSHVVGSVVSLILNASLGASGGASGASHSLFAGSSAGHTNHNGGKF
ncbi:uncharacterized protein LOC133321065 [Musca vetustissima]|uniref:uncharacterized protein LOC133321065 n=1 Tax=Musca vetustissima TaxID=27455 RepID=UPI002AB7DAB9|nr:uncharacterized protein LOC133321065 [Musca vetustissima]